jgi:hypothetical protein
VTNTSGAIGSATAKSSAVSPKKSKDVKSEKVAVHSQKNVSWTGVGKLYRGYNIVTSKAAAIWTTKSYVRLATPEEVAREFGN